MVLSITNTTHFERRLGRRIAAAATVLSVVLFLTSLTQDGYYIDRPGDPRAWAPCIGLLLIGWLGVFDGILAWLANPALLAAWIFLNFRSSRRLGAAIGAAAIAFALSFLLYTEILTNEAGGTSKITGYGAGYWLWVASGGVAMIGGLAAWVSDWKSAAEGASS